MVFVNFVTIHPAVVDGKACLLLELELELGDSLDAVFFLSTMPFIKKCLDWCRVAFFAFKSAVNGTVPFATVFFGIVGYVVVIWAGGISTWEVG